MIIPARFNGKCATCGGALPKGSNIEYADGKAHHPQCYQPPIDYGDDPYHPPSETELALADRLHFRLHDPDVVFPWSTIRFEETLK